MSSKTIKLILAVIIGVPLTLVAISFAAVLALREGSTTDVAAPIEIHAPAEPILLGDVDEAIKVSEPTNGATLPIQRDLTRSVQLETVKHLATASGAFSNYDLFVFDEVVTDTETNRETIEHCIVAYEGLPENETVGGGMCSLDEFTGPVPIQFYSKSRGSIEVALFFTEAGSATMAIDTETAYVVSSNLVNGVGFVQYEASRGQPKRITLYDSDGVAVWSSPIS